MHEFMNEPVDHIWTEEEIRQEYSKNPDKKKISKTFCLEMKELNRIIKE